MIKYDDKFFDTIFPLLSFQSPDKNLQISLSNYVELDNTDDTLYNDCKFFFPDDPSACIDYVNRKRTQYIAENRYAYDACQSDSNPMQCCKLKSQNNDIAYNICIKNINQKNNSTENKNLFILIFIIFFFTILIIFLSIYIYHKLKEWYKYPNLTTHNT